jgi:hypothetical protein
MLWPHRAAFSDDVLRIRAGVERDLDEMGPNDATRPTLAVSVVIADCDDRFDARVCAHGERAARQVA